MTRRGLLTLAVGVCLAVCGRLFGLPEIIAMGLVIAGLVGVTLLAVFFPRAKLVPTRRLRPERITVGQTAHVDLGLNQRGRLGSGLIRICDSVSETDGAELHSTSIPGGSQTRATFRVRPPARGVVEVGPLIVQRLDPFGLVRRRIAKLAPSELLVHPAIVDIAPPPRPRSVDLAASVATPVLELKGEDFHALRPYERGDDLRRVHWKATARHDDLMIREHDDSREGRTTVVADVRSSAVSDLALERILTAAASILHAAASRGDEVALVLTDGTAPQAALDAKSLTPLFDALARAQPDSLVRSLDPARQVLRSHSRAGTLVSLLGDGNSGDAASELGVGFQSHICLTFGFREDHASAITTNFEEQWAAEVQVRSTASVRL